jgi:hypothetical protein
MKRLKRLLDIFGWSSGNGLDIATHLGISVNVLHHAKDETINDLLEIKGYYGQHLQ